MTDPSSPGPGSMVKRHGVVLFLILAPACSGHGLPTAPTTMPPAPTPIPRPLPPAITSTVHLTGTATDDDGGPVTGATVTVEPNGYPTISRVTDGRGYYSIDFDTYHLDIPRVILGFLIAASPGRDRFVNWTSAPATGGQNVVQDLHLYRVKRITVGGSTLVTVVPGDTTCSEDGFFVCRIVHVEVPNDGLLTMEVVPIPSATNTGLAILDDIGDGSRPSKTIHATAGTEVVVFIGMVWTSTVSGGEPCHAASIRSPDLSTHVVLCC